MLECSVASTFNNVNVFVYWLLYIYHISHDIIIHPAFIINFNICSISLCECNSTYWVSRMEFRIWMLGSILGLYSLSRRASYLNILWSIEAARSGFRFFRSLRCLSKFRVIWSLLHHITGLQDFMRFSGKTFYRLRDRGCWEAGHVNLTICCVFWQWWPKQCSQWHRLSWVDGIIGSSIINRLIGNVCDCKWDI